MEKIAVERSIWIDTQLETAWQAVTEPAHLNQWYATHYHWDIPALRVGAPVRFYNKADESDAQSASIEVVNPPHEFRLRWQPHRDYPNVSLVTAFLLQTEKDGTRVTIYESGYEGVPAHERQDWLDATGGGYTLSMENLKAHLEGQPIPH